MEPTCPGGVQTNQGFCLLFAISKKLMYKNVDRNPVSKKKHLLNALLSSGY